MRLSTLFVLAAAFGVASGAPGQVRPTREEVEQSRRWFDSYLGGTSKQPPFSFAFGGRPSAELLPSWKLTCNSERLDRDRTLQSLLWVDPSTGLQITCRAVVYSDFPTVEWTLYFKNKGSRDTPILEHLLSLDVRWNRPGTAEYLLHHNIGSPANRSDYSPLETPLGPNASKRMSGAGGRPTNSDMSYFNLAWGDAGAIVVVGWPGQWAAEFARYAGNGIHITAGQELTHFVLHPGEEVRTPLIVLQAWRGDWIRGQNLWRRWMIAHNIPRLGRSLTLPSPQFVASSSRAYEEMKGANEANQIMHIDRYLEEGLKLDYWWMDAGWYVQQQGWPQVGTWEVDRSRFPSGFKPISDHAHARGVKTLVWFEPERVAPGTWLYEKHPEWLLSADPGRARSLAGLAAWRSETVTEPCVCMNTSDRTISVAAIRWDPGQLSFHPGPKGEYSVVRWTAPGPGEYRLRSVFTGIDAQTTTDVHVLHRGRPIFNGFINLNGQGRRAEHHGTLNVLAGDTVDFVVGYGNGSYICDSTGLVAVITGPDGSVHDAAKSFRIERNPNTEWSYGWLKPGTSPDASTFQLYAKTGKGEDGQQKLLNMGNPDAWKWLVDHIDGLITENRIDLYRQDFNIDPLTFWRANDAPDRQGITEIKHVTGYLAYWDELRRRHPNMLIDSCASGGRRNDLETMRRAVPLWRSDYAFEPIGHQCMTYGISQWLPYHGTGTVMSAAAPYYGGGATKIEPYAFWSNTAPSLGSGIDIRERGLDYDLIRKLITQWRTLNEYYFADFYPLTPYSQADDAWIAWQFNRPEKGDAAVQVFRRPKASAGSANLKLFGLDAKRRYVIADADGRKVGEFSGRDLMEIGLPVRIAEAPGAAVIFIRQHPE